MDLKEAIKNIKVETYLPRLSTGHDDTIAEFYTDMVEPLLLDEHVVKQWYKMLKEYVEDEDAVFAIRTGNTRKDGDGTTLRRPFFNKIKGTKLSFYYDDNDLAVLIFKLALMGFVPTKAEFKDALRNHWFPMHFNPLCKEEVLKKGGRVGCPNPNIGRAGYKVSHIIDAGDNFLFKGKETGITEICNKYFNLGNYTDWTYDSTEGVYSRIITVKDSDALEFLKAETLRFLCPFNYVLTPKTQQPKCQKTAVAVYKKDIGEHGPFQEYVLSEYKKKYGSLYKEYLGKLMLPPGKTTINHGNEYIGIDYGFGVCGGSVPALKVPRTSKPRKTKNVIITLNPSDEKKFKEQLLKTKKAERTLIFNDGTKDIKTWNASNFTAQSNLRANIKSSSYYRESGTNGLVEIQLKVIK